MVVRPKDDTIDLRYLEYYFRGGIGISQAITGAAQPQITRTNLEPLTIQFPTSLDEQRRIVAVLDKAFAAIATGTANAQKNQFNARALFESYLQSALPDRGKGWVEKRLHDVSTLQRGFDLPTQDRQAGDVPLVSSSGVIGYVADAKVRAPGIATGRSGSIGNVFYVEQDFWPLNTSLYVKDFNGNHPRFVFWLLTKFDLAKYATGSGVPTLNRNFVHDEMVWLPENRKTQVAIARSLDELKSLSVQLETVASKRMLALAELKQSLLQKAFAGELITALAEPTAPAANDNFATPQGTANMIAFAYWLHKKQNRDKSYKRIKAQKCLHNVESIAGIDLGRQPTKHRNGPHDEAHMSRAEDWAREHRFFEFVQSTSGPGKDFKKLGNYDAMWAETVTATKTIAAALERAIDPLIPMDMEKAELFATVHAAWNNLLQNGAAITDDAIVKEARDDWHPDKLKIPEHKFRDTIRTIKTKGMEPDGSAKYVGGQVSLF